MSTVRGTAGRRKYQLNKPRYRVVRIFGFRLSTKPRRLVHTFRRRLPLGQLGDPYRTLMGVDAFTVIAPDLADNLRCWTLCETNHNPQMHEGLVPNRITDVFDLGTGEYLILLLRPITHGEVTTLSYLTNQGSVTSGVFTYHPGDVDADSAGISLATDILALIDAMNGVFQLPIEQTDLDRSGVVSPSDILREIDLLNGAGQFDSWLGVQTDSDGCP